ncbi:MAG: hypothetical protein Q7T20_03305 [Saprospiraceae bacterium]|nr:hypothetical protein [Saprospiraceae bacterium]
MKLAASRMNPIGFEIFLEKIEQLCNFRPEKRLLQNNTGGI